MDKVGTETAEDFPKTVDGDDVPCPCAPSHREFDPLHPGILICGAVFPDKRGITQRRNNDGRGKTVRQSARQIAEVAARTAFRRFQHIEDMDRDHAGSTRLARESGSASAKVSEGL